jgi:hypothetical protein
MIIVICLFCLYFSSMLRYLSILFINYKQELKNNEYKLINLGFVIQVNILFIFFFYKNHKSEKLKYFFISFY